MCRRIDGGSGEVDQQPEVVTYENLYSTTEGAIVRDDVSIGNTSVNDCVLQAAGFNDRITATEQQYGVTFPRHLIRLDDQNTV